ncbi:MAG: YbjN domain-containing protein [Chloroflexota bacterium]
MFGFGGRNQPNRDTSENPSVRTMKQHADTIDAILTQIGLNPQDVRMNTDEGYGWSFRRGSAVIEVYLSEQSGEGFLQVLSPIMHIPTANVLPLYRHLLELNLQLTSAAMGVYNDVVYVFYERPLQGLDASEANDIISKVAGYADDLDNQLVDEFGGRLYMQV